MKTLKASTKGGQNIIARASKNEGRYLWQVYGKCSQKKEHAMWWCEDAYALTENSTDFHICSHNTFGFTVAWLGTFNNENILRYETKDNSYLVWLDR